MRQGIEEMTPIWPRVDLARLIAVVSLIRMATDNEMSDAAQARFGGWPDAVQVERAICYVEKYGVKRENGGNDDLPILP